MTRRFLAISATIVLALVILFSSIARTATIRHSFTIPQEQNGDSSVLGETTQINYKLPYPGKVLPDHPLWTVKVVRDRLWLLVSTRPERKAELNLLFADKRLVSSRMLFEKNKPGIAFSTLTKAEKYLEEAYLKEEKARSGGVDTSEFLHNLSKASLKHIEEIDQMITIAPEEAKPQMIKVRGEYPQRIYERTRDALFEVGETPPENPF